MKIVLEHHAIRFLIMNELVINSTRFELHNSKYFIFLQSGHGRMIRFDSIQEKNDNIQKALEYFKKEDETMGMLGIGYR